MTTLPQFDAFFRELWGRDPFPWQAMLAQLAVSGAWPEALDLPTAAGKTAVIDIAVFALAAQGDQPVTERAAPRRIWFVVDRRIVVDEAYERAQVIARKLEQAREGPLGAVADRLRAVAGTDRPLAVARLRGGVFRDDGWARVPSQPAVITSTVDQVGSRLLFRAYGPSQLAAPIYAGLAANDSLIVVDEAHCAVPFVQTLQAVRTYRGAAWAEMPARTPFAVVILSATPPAGIKAGAVFPGEQRDAALSHPILARRLGTSKLATLVEVKDHKGRQDDPLVGEAARRAADYVQSGRMRVGAMLNRVRTAEEVARTLRSRMGETADVVLLTGRIRPFERDRLVDRWKGYLRAASPEEPPRPIVLVSTQCLEVGADFSFGALVSEIASLDALRQRFGRLARMGTDEAAPATILARTNDAAAKGPDPIYGDALSATWGLLRDRAAQVSAGGDADDVVVDFGVEALNGWLSDLGDLTPYLAPTTDAPVLLPAHLDLLCQTSPPPHPEPELQLFLRGKSGGPPDVQVIWRADLSSGDPDEMWIETVALCRPFSGEMLSVPFYRLRTWLARPGSRDESSDVEGLDGEDGEGAKTTRDCRCLLWRGRDGSKVTRNPWEIGPGDVVVLPAACGIDGLGQSVPEQALGDRLLDLWEPASASVGRAAVRLHRSVLGPWLACPAVSYLVELAESPVLDRESIQDAIDAVLEYRPQSDAAPPPPPSWWLDLLQRAQRGRLDKHPAGGLVLEARESTATVRTSEPDLFADADDLTSAGSEEVSLVEHSRLVERTVARVAERCLPAELVAPLRHAAYWHDAGKLDERFQAYLRQGDELAVLAAESPIAKSLLIPTSPTRRRAIRETSGLPENFRHEMLSVRLAERHLLLAHDAVATDLILHLVASHHGHARPFAPICDDPQPPGVSGRLEDLQIELNVDERRNLPPAHRFDSGLAERFWRLTRRYGWWGLAYLDAILRLGDWYASRLAEERSTTAADRVEAAS